MEQFNQDKEMIGLEKTKDLFSKMAADSPKKIIDILMEEGSRWRNGASQTDDITFIVMKAN